MVSVKGDVKLSVMGDMKYQTVIKHPTSSHLPILICHLYMKCFEA